MKFCFIDKVKGVGPGRSEVYQSALTRISSMTASSSDFCTVQEAMAELRAGRMIVLVDDEYRENEGDLVVAAEKATPESINFMARNACGIVCLAMSPAICDRLHLEPLAGHNVDPQATPFTPYIDA